MTDVDIADLIVKSISSITDVAVHSELTKKGTGLELEPSIMELIRIEKNIVSLKKVLEDTKALHLATPSSTRAQPDYNPTSALKDLVYERDEEAEKRSNHYDYFRKSLAKVGVVAPRAAVKRPANSNNNDDDDLEIAQGELDVICPISRVVMTNPVKNPCGHTYSRAAAEEYHKKQMRAKKTARVICPIAGCTAVLDVAHFVVDQDMEYAILAHKNKRQNVNDDDKYEAV